MSSPCPKYTTKGKRNRDGMKDVDPKGARSCITHGPRLLYAYLTCWIMIALMNSWLCGPMASLFTTVGFPRALGFPFYFVDVAGFCGHFSWTFRRRLLSFNTHILWSHEENKVGQDQEKQSLGNVSTFGTSLSLSFLARWTRGNLNTRDLWLLVSKTYVYVVRSDFWMWW